MLSKLILTRSDWEDQIDRIPWLINICRCAVAVSMLISHFMVNHTGLETIRYTIPTAQFYFWLACYGLLITISFIRPRWLRQQREDLPNTGAVIDISMIMILLYLAGGVTSGLGILVLPFVATSCLLSYGRYPLLYASYTTICLLAVMSARGQIALSMAYWDSRSLSAAIILITAIFAVSFLTSLGATYLRYATASAVQHKRAFNRIHGLNQLVLNRVQEAVIVLDDKQKIILFNRQAKTYFPGLTAERTETIFTELIDRWQRAPDKPFEADIHLHQHAMHIRAMPLIQEDSQLLMIFARSLREIASEAMATKLASLGQLTANLAHEVRNPMSAITHAASLLADDEELDPVHAKLINIISTNIRRIDKMLEEVSSLNKKDALGRESVSLMKFWMAFKQEFLLNNPGAVGCVRMQMQGKNLTVMADPMHVQQIMWNLCNNAWRHSKKDADAIKVLIRPSGKLNISIVISDNGPGVRPDIRNRLFEPFFTTESNGTGLGLYVARELAHANLGQLHYHPEMNGFELILPKDKNHEE